jgi:Flp pilus assembly pilin Flp
VTIRKERSTESGQALVGYMFITAFIAIPMIFIIKIATEVSTLRGERWQKIVEIMNSSNPTTGIMTDFNSYIEGKTK